MPQSGSVIALSSEACACDLVHSYPPTLPPGIIHTELRLRDLVYRKPLSSRRASP
jgi:hypothetical protein